MSGCGRAAGRTWIDRSASAAASAALVSSGSIAALARCSIMSVSSSTSVGILPVAARCCAAAADTARAAVECSTATRR